MIPLKIETLLAGKVVEQNRVEYKEGWNPDEIIRTICAFANDYSNVNGGYIVIGIREKNGLPLLPPPGIPNESLDKIQREIFQYCNQIFPRYIPKIEVVDYHRSGVNLLYLWCSAGDAGPYQSPENIYAGKNKKINKNMKYWIRPASLTVQAKQEEISELFEKFNAVPFDDRVNRQAKLTDIRRAYVEDFLRESNSSLANDLNTSTLEELLLALEVANETDTDVQIRNIGILMFADAPHKLIPGAQIDLVRFYTEEEEAADDFTERTFTGPIYKQIRDALDYLRNSVIEERVIKVEGKAEAERYFTYPYNALEELLVNAVFHKSYREPEPVEIRIYVDYIQILNYPGPAKWIDMEKFVRGKVRSRKYRNRRIGEFLKEIDLSEKQSTGITKILKEIRLNGSPVPEFETDENREYLIATIRMRDGFGLYETPQSEEGFPQTGEETPQSTPQTPQKTLENAEITPQTPQTNPANPAKITGNTPQTSEITPQTPQSTPQSKLMQEEILDLLKADPSLSQRKIAEELSLSYEAVRYKMGKMRQEGILGREGSGRSGRWVIHVLQ